jgi:hypothetical protein
MDIEESLHRILQEKENVASRFFLERHPEARRYFTGVDMTGQAQLLRLALIMVERQHTHRPPAEEPARWQTKGWWHLAVASHSE